MLQQLIYLVLACWKVPDLLYHCDFFLIVCQLNRLDVFFLFWLESSMFHGYMSA
jgi:hypothetical protein